MKNGIWNCAFCIVVGLAISTEAYPQLFGTYSHIRPLGNWRRPYYLQPLNQNENNLFPSKPINTCDSCECGVIRRNRIVNGDRANHSEFPWLVKLDYNGSSHCGGTIISPRHIITAAHCTEGGSASSFTMKLADGTERRGKTIHQHPRYNKRTFDSDIAIIEMESYVDFDGRAVKRVCLPTEEQDFSGSRGVAAGWGIIMEDLPGNENLNKVILPIMSKAECDKSGYGKYEITDNMFCAGYMEGGEDTCQGDSGGPLTVRENGRMVLAGIVSNGRGCAREEYPGLYTKVSYYLSWITENTDGECICSNKN